MNIQCPNCGQPFAAVVETVIDAGQDPQAKARLLSGQATTARCPNCGSPATVATPILYHDASNELLLVHVPMELNLPKQQQEKLVGDLMRELTSRLPKESMKGYLFQPKQALTMQGMIEQILQADGVTPEMMDAQRERVRLIEQFMSTPDDLLPSLVQQHDTSIDAQFLQTMTLMAQRMVQEGRVDVAEQVLATQQMVAENSTFGKQVLEQSRVQEEIIREVAEELEGMGQTADRDTFLNLAMGYAGADQRLQALVGLARPAFDYAFFQDLTMRISQAPADDRDRLENLREQLLQLTAMVDQQTQMAVQQAAGLLQEIINSPDIDAAIRDNLPMFDDTFMAVLSANIQEAQRQSDIQLSGRLKQVYERVVATLRENMQPELRFINELLSIPDDQARTMVAEQAASYGPPLLDMFDAVERVLESRGETDILEKLALLREEAEQALG